MVIIHCIMCELPSYQCVSTTCMASLQLRTILINMLCKSIGNFIKYRVQLGTHLGWNLAAVEAH